MLDVMFVVCHYVLAEAVGQLRMSHYQFSSIGMQLPTLCLTECQ